MKRFRRENAVQQQTAMATVTGCHYEFGSGQALAFGIPRSRKFHITFNYWAGDQLQAGEFYAAKPMQQGEMFPITYHPSAPHVNSKSSSGALPARLIPLAGFAAVAVAVGTLIMMRGCP